MAQMRDKVVHMMNKPLTERIAKKRRAYEGLMREGRVWARISPALRPYVRRYLSANPGQLNTLINVALAEHFDAKAAEDRLDAEAHIESLLGGGAG